AASARVDLIPRPVQAPTSLIPEGTRLFVDFIETLLSRHVSVNEANSSTGDRGNGLPCHEPTSQTSGRLPCGIFRQPAESSVDNTTHPIPRVARPTDTAPLMGSTESGLAASQGTPQVPRSPISVNRVGLPNRPTHRGGVFVANEKRSNRRAIDRQV